jgi:hypothetical protein
MALAGWFTTAPLMSGWWLTLYFGMAPSWVMTAYIVEWHWGSVAVSFELADGCGLVVRETGIPGGGSGLSIRRKASSCFGRKIVQLTKRG